MHALCKVPDGQMPVTFSLPGFPESLHLLWLACSCCPGLAAIYELKGQRDSPAQGRPGARPRSSLASSCRLRAGSIPPLLLASGQFLPWKEMLGGGAPHWLSVLPPLLGPALLVRGPGRRQESLHWPAREP